jgi:hypothetical protein
MTGQEEADDEGPANAGPWNQTYYAMLTSICLGFAFSDFGR